jgi:hypothetical protein
MSTSAGSIGIRRSLPPLPRTWMTAPSSVRRRSPTLARTSSSARNPASSAGKDQGAVALHPVGAPPRLRVGAGAGVAGIDSAGVSAVSSHGLNYRPVCLPRALPNSDDLVPQGHSPPIRHRQHCRSARSRGLVDRDGSVGSGSGCQTGAGRYCVSGDGAGATRGRRVMNDRAGFGTEAERMA